MINPIRASFSYVLARFWPPKLIKLMPPPRPSASRVRFGAGGSLAGVKGAYVPASAFHSPADGGVCAGASPGVVVAAGATTVVLTASGLWRMAGVGETAPMMAAGGCDETIEGTVDGESAPQSPRPNEH